MSETNDDVLEHPDEYYQNEYQILPDDNVLEHPDNDVSEHSDEYYHYLGEPKYPAEQFEYMYEPEIYDPYKSEFDSTNFDIAKTDIIKLTRVDYTNGYMCNNNNCLHYITYDTENKTDVYKLTPGWIIWQLLERFDFPDDAIDDISFYKHFSDAPRRDKLPNNNHRNPFPTESEIKTIKKEKKLMKKKNEESLERLKKKIKDSETKRACCIKTITDANELYKLKHENPQVTISFNTRQKAVKATPMLRKLEKFAPNSYVLNITADDNISLFFNTIIILDENEEVMKPKHIKTLELYYECDEEKTLIARWIGNIMFDETNFRTESLPILYSETKPTCFTVFIKTTQLISDIYGGLIQEKPTYKTFCQNSQNSRLFNMSQFFHIVHEKIYSGDLCEEYDLVTDGYYVDLLFILFNKETGERYNNIHKIIKRFSLNSGCMNKNIYDNVPTGIFVKDDIVTIRQVLFTDSMSTLTLQGIKLKNPSLIFTLADDISSNYKIKIYGRKHMSLDLSILPKKNNKVAPNRYNYPPIY